MSDHEWEGIGLYQAIINIIAASTSAALGVLKLTGGTMSGVIAMGSQLITGLAQATAAGHALRYEALGTGTLPAAGTLFTASNHVITGLASDDEGRHWVVVTSTASHRLSGETQAGSSIACALRRSMATSTVAAPAGGAVVMLGRVSAAGKYVAFGRNATGYYLSIWTDKDTLASGTTVFGSYPGGADSNVRLRSDGAGAIVAEIGAGGVWSPACASLTETAVFGSPGAPDLIGRGIHTGAQTSGTTAATFGHEVIS